MSQILTGSELVEKPYDKFWDEPPTRREMQKVFNKLGQNDAELMGMADTASILLNYLCEKLGVKREDVEAYVLQKTEELKTLRTNLKAEAEAADKAKQ